jgi:hypothetical protein
MLVSFVISARPRGSQGRQRCNSGFEIELRPRRGADIVTIEDWRVRRPLQAAGNATMRIPEEVARESAMMSPSIPI